MKARDKRKIISAIKTCNYRIRNELRVNSIISLGNIGAKYPGYVKSIDALIELLDEEQLKERIIRGNLHRSFYRYVVMSRDRKGFASYAVEKIKIISLKTIVKIGIANPELISNKLIDRLWTEMNDILSKDRIKKEHCECSPEWYSINYGKYLGILARKSDYAFKLLINALFTDVEILKRTAIYALGFSERGKEVLPYVDDIIKSESFNVSAITKLALGDPDGYGNRVLSLMKECKSKALCVSLLGRIAAMSKDIKEAYIDTILPYFYSDDPREQMAASYAISLMFQKALAKLESIVQEHFLKFRGKSLYRISCVNVDFVLNLAKKYGELDRWAGELIAERWPEKIINLFKENPEILHYEVILKALSLTSIPSKDVGWIKDKLWGIIEDSTPCFSIFKGISEASAKNPHLFSDMVYPLASILEKYNREKGTDYNLHTGYFLEMLKYMAPIIPDVAIELSLNHPYYLDSIVEIFDHTGNPDFYYKKYFLELVWAISTVRNEMHKSEQLMEGLRKLSYSHPEITLEFVDEITFMFYGEKYPNKYCIMKAIEILKNLILKGHIEEGIYLRYIVESLGHPNYRVFNAAKKALRQIITKDNCQLILDEAKFIGDPIVTRRAKKIISARKLSCTGR